VKGPGSWRVPTPNTCPICDGAQTCERHYVGITDDEKKSIIAEGTGRVLPTDSVLAHVERGELIRRVYRKDDE